jgi:hypothetical protein
MLWLLDVSSGIEQVSDWGGNQVDHGYEGIGISVTPCACPGGFQQPAPSAASP